MSSVKAFKVEPGTVIVFEGYEFRHTVNDTRHDLLPGLVDAIAEACGHRQFTIINHPDDGGTVTVITGQEALEAVRAALPE